jgi:hypothetical protein
VEDEMRVKRRKVWDEWVDDAIAEGDEWRKEVLESSVYRPAEKKVAGAHTGTGAAQPPTYTPPIVPAVTWPESLKYGVVYTVDLKNRVKRNGVAIDWRAEDGVVVMQKGYKYII